METKRNLETSHFYLPYNSKLVARAKHFRQNPTPAEQKLWKEYLKTFPYRVLRQRPIDHFIVDFYCAALKLVIEVDGDVHLSEESQIYDLERSLELSKYGLQILRFTNNEVINNFDSVCQQIERFVCEFKSRSILDCDSSEDPPSPLRKGEQDKKSL